MKNRATAVVLALVILITGEAVAQQQKKYGPGVSDTEIVLGNLCAYSGPASAFSAIGKAMSAYFDKVNAEGGINGRKIRFISVDDGHSPPKSLEAVRKLVEEDKVFAVVGNVGTAPNMATYRYLNQRKVPDLFVISGLDMWNNPKDHPWTVGFIPSFATEARIHAHYILQHVKNPKVAVLYLNDDQGKEILRGLKEGFGDKLNSVLVAEASFEMQDPTVDSQVLKLASSGANVFVLPFQPKAAAQAIRKAYDINWKPLRLLGSPAASVNGTLAPAGLDKSVGILAANYIKDPTDKHWENDSGYKEFVAWLKKYDSSADAANTWPPLGYTVAQLVAYVLKQCGNDLTRENLLRQAQNLKDVSLPMLLPGITISSRPDAYTMMDRMQLERFNGQKWEVFGQVQK